MSAPPSASAPSRGASLRAELSRFQRRWRLGLLAAGLLHALFWAGAALVLFGLLDYLAGFGDAGRRMVSASLGVIAAAIVLYALWELLLFTRRRAAHASDQALRDPRRRVLSALELERQPAPAAPLGAWLRANAVDRAAANLRELDLRHSLPLPQLRHGALRVGIVVLLLIVCFAASPAASRLVARRLLDPAADLPPYSPLQFTLTPAPAEVLYGGDLVMTAQIKGGEINAPVRCLTRDPVNHRIDEVPAFRETSDRYSQKLEKVSAPVEIAFAVGRARSAWLPVRVRTQPKIQEVTVTVEPPAYSGLPRREFTAGTQPLAVLAGSRITARAASNRPLAGGDLSLVAGEGAPPQRVAAATEAQNRVRFDWVARDAARITLMVKDVLGTGSEPLEFEQKIVPDQRPEVTLREPAGDVIATPDGELPLEYSASDDLGLARLALVRKLEGFRERTQEEPIPAASRRQEVQSKLSLASYGLVPGQTIELSAEAADTNPTLLGVAVSEPARIHIITREKYAELMRQQTTLEEFSARYEALREAMSEARKALDDLAKAVESGNAKAIEEARQKALEAHQKAGQTFGEVARDFPLFGLDQKLSETSAEVMTRLFENAKDLEGLANSSPQAMKEALPELQNRLGASEKEMEGQMKLGQEAAAAGKVMEQASRFNEIVSMQRELVKNLNRIIEAIRRGEMPAAEALSETARNQERTADALRQFEKDLTEAASALPDSLSEMRDETEKFLELLKQSAIPPVMDAARDAARAADANNAGARAGEALALLEALLRHPNGFCEMCEGEGGAKFNWPEDLSDTLSQMMAGLIPRPGEQEGSGNGRKRGSGSQGFNGWNENGFTMRGQSPRVPAYGPPRANFGARGGPDARTGKGHGAGQNHGDSSEVAREELAYSEPRKAAGESVSPDAVPEPYREALKRYFSDAAPANPAPAPAPSATPPSPPANGNLPTPSPASSKSP